MTPTRDRGLALAPDNSPAEIVRVLRRAGYSPPIYLLVVYRGLWPR